MKSRTLLLAFAALATCDPAHASFVVYEGSGSAAAAITSTRDAFRAAVGGGSVAGASGSFGGPVAAARPARSTP